ncbi:hypothetical protein OIU77_002517 [Salix suchowensis]|uniref:Uncharacterized protein n=1 Tax=Salix suchowensis TaxID=1278906 RepID=A0ABQ9AXU2_9ROSI|nr:hypothetical protein OIU77_002517 [Salix suchowensis]
MTTGLSMILKLLILCIEAAFAVFLGKLVSFWCHYGCFKLSCKSLFLQKWLEVLGLYLILIMYIRRLSEGLLGSMLTPVHLSFMLLLAGWL